MFLIALVVLTAGLNQIGGNLSVLVFYLRIKTSIFSSSDFPVFASSVGGPATSVFDDYHLHQLAFK